MDGGKTDFTCDMVIAIYKENLMWLKDYEKKEYNFRNMFLYNKNSENNNKTSLELGCVMNGKECVKTNLPNVGRCDHTYLYHIITHYDNLADVTIFTKGSSDLYREKAKLNFITKKVFQTKNSVFSVDRLPLSVNITFKDFTLNTYKASHPSNNEKGIMSVFSKRMEPAKPRPFGAWYEKNFHGINAYHVSYAAVMAVSRELIHKHPVEYYQTFLKQLDDGPNPEVGHYIERAWIALFNPVPESCMYIGGGFTQHGGRKRKRTQRRKVRRGPRNKSRRRYPDV